MAIKKASHQTDRQTITDFREIINVGPAFVGDFALLGLKTPQDLIGKAPADLFIQLQEVTKNQQDPCVLDVLISVVDFMNGNPPKVWWKYTSDRKKKYLSLFEPQ